jgi:ubiquinol-cytochrome c reductase cytochrome b/c1 subunit
LYFYVHFWILLPVIGKIERPRPLPTSIAASVLGGEARLSSAAPASIGKP